MGKAHKRETCRLCESKDFERVLELTPTAPADAYVPADQLNIEQEIIPLELYLCRNCGVTQLLDVVDTEEVYLNYIYETVSSLGLVKHFDEYADSVMEQFKPEPGRLVLDIGSNDGTLLKFFKKHGLQVLGIDPAPEIARMATEKGIETLPVFFTEEYARQLKEKYGTAAVITSNNLIADVDNLTDCIKGIREMLAPDGVFLFESFYLVHQIQNFVWDFTYHEHFSYFTVKPLKAYFDSLGMELFEAQLIGTKGGSIRYKIQLKGGPHKVSPRVKELIRIEEEMGVQQSEVFKEYSERIENAKREFRGLLGNLKAQGKSIAGFGASATSTTLIYHYEMGNDIDFLVDDYKAKQNLFSPGYHIPVYSPEEVFKRKPDYVIILAWRFAEPIMKKYQRYIDEGGHFIIPLPDIKVI